MIPLITRDFSNYQKWSGEGFSAIRLLRFTTSDGQEQQIVYYQIFFIYYVS